MSDTVTIYVAVEHEEQALAIARTLLGERLVACANILPPGRSVYRWQGEVMDEPETFMLLKTASARAGAVVARIAEIHPYEVPCIGVWPWQGGHRDYMDWVAEETGSKA